MAEAHPGASQSKCETGTTHLVKTKVALHVRLASGAFPYYIYRLFKEGKPS
jgi:hypothetical protein